jgi:hypothetical protein
MNNGIRVNSGRDDGASIQSGALQTYRTAWRRIAFEQITVAKSL